MHRTAADLTEAAALLVVAAALAVGGRALLAQLHVFAPAAVALLAFAIVALAVSLRRLYAGGDVERVEVSRRIAYLTGLVLALWAVASPASWVIGASLAMLELAIAFDLFSRFVPRPRT